MCQTRVLVRLRMSFTVCVTALLSFAACASPTRDEPPVPSAPNASVAVGTAFTLAPGESVTVDGSSLRLMFVKTLEDSRCPSSVQCVWAGRVRLAMVSMHAGATREFVIETLPPRDTATVGPYLVKLAGVSPERTTTDAIPPAAYRATMRVSRNE